MELYKAKFLTNFIKHIIENCKKSQKLIEGELDKIQLMLERCTQCKDCRQCKSHKQS